MKLIIDPVTDATETAQSIIVRDMATGNEETVTDQAVIRAFYNDPSAKSYGEGSYTVGV